MRNQRICTENPVSFLPADRPGAVGLDNEERLGPAPADFTVVGADFVYQKVALGQADASDDEVAVAGVGDANFGQRGFVDIRYAVSPDLAAVLEPSHGFQRLKRNGPIAIGADGQHRCVAEALVVGHDTGVATDCVDQQINVAARGVHCVDDEVLRAAVADFHDARETRSGEVDHVIAGARDGHLLEVLEIGEGVVHKGLRLGRRPLFLRCRAQAFLAMWRKETFDAGYPLQFA